MSSKKWLVLIVAVLIGIAVVALVSGEYRDEVKAFLRALARAL